MDCDQHVAMKTANSVAAAHEFLTPKLYSPGMIESTNIAALHVACHGGECKNTNSSTATRVLHKGNHDTVNRVLPLTHILEGSDSSGFIATCGFSSVSAGSGKTVAPL